MKTIGLTLLVLVVCLLPAAGEEATDSSPISPLPGFAPDPEAATGKVGSRGEWTFLAGSVAARLTPLDQETRQAYFKEHLEVPTDPFAGRPGEPPPFMTFLLEVANGSSETVVVKPEKIWLVTNANRVRTPMNRLEIESAFRMQDAEMPPAYGAAAGLLLNREVSLANGQKVVGLLAFEALPKKTRWFKIDLDFTGPMAESIRFRAMYRKAKGKKKQ